MQKEFTSRCLVSRFEKMKNQILNMKALNRQKACIYIDGLAHKELRCVVSTLVNAHRQLL